MTIDYAKFTGEIAKGIKIGESLVEVKLNIPLKAALPHLMFLSNNQGQEVFVHLGDPQASFDFGEDDDMYRKWIGHRVTADSSGVVTNIERTETDEEKDENQTELFQEDGQEHHVVEEVTGDENVSTVNGVDHPYCDNYDLPEWMKEEETAVSGEPEMEFGEDGAEPEQSSEIDKDALEQYILKERPSFPDMPLDFPNFFELKRNQGATWREIANSVGMTTGQLTSKLTKYKERVREQMSGNVVA